MQSCLAHLQANEEGVLYGEDPEFVHQLRVALRRMRSALSVFAELVPKEKTLSLREELRWLTKELDGARNWDVLALETMSPICAAFPDSEGLAQLSSRISEVRQQRDAQARGAVASSRYSKFLLDLGAWLCTAPWRDATGTEARAPEPCIADFAANVLQKRHKQLKKRGKSIASLSSPERHRVRIAAKKLRYAAEFFSSLYSRKRAREYIAALSALQDVLGALNDTATTLTLLQELQVAEHDTSQQQAVGIVRGWVLGADHVRLKDVERVWQQFLEQKIFW
jgi:CHAD domain-containing protein